MKKNYEKPMVELLKFDYSEVITASNGIQKTMTPGNHSGCTVMPNGKPLPPNAEGYWAKR